jgi:DNA polymerase elongation subunit (family B)
MKTHNFTLVNCDTDSISFSKPDGSPFTEQEQTNLLKELNSHYPEKIRFEHDGIYDVVCILKAKNYILVQNGKIKKKGSSLKSSKIEKGLSDLMNQVIDALVFDKQHTLLDIYHKFIKEVNNVQDINRWTKKLTVTEKILNPERKNEQKPYDAIQGKGLQQGDKFWVYETDKDTMKLAEEWNQSLPDVDVVKLMKRIHSTLNIFKNVINIEQFPKYHLKNKKIKEELQQILK